MTINSLIPMRLVMLSALFLILVPCCKKEKDDSDTVKDIDGNVYNTVNIGTQVWMKENLKTTRYNDGKSIPTGYTNEQWKNLTTDAYAIYPYADIDGLNSEPEVLQAYGALYNWYAVSKGNLCPVGWHVSTDAELTTLINFAGGKDFASPKLRDTSTEPDAHPRWVSPNAGVVNIYDFSVLPGGERAYNDGGFWNLGYTCYLWSSTDESSGYEVAWGRIIMSDRDNIERMAYPKKEGLSVRCVKD
jgi:uncharacterized protein (TIGR02145 family)